MGHDLGCPHCNATLDAWAWFWDGVTDRADNTEFIMSCPRCGAEVTIDVEATPTFSVREEVGE